VRSGPGINYALLETLPSASVVSILEGPVAGDGYTWWKVRSSSSIEGWAVDFADGEATLLPGVMAVSDSSPTPGGVTCSGVPARFHEGDIVVVSRLGNAMRLMTDYNRGARGAIGQLYQGNQVQIQGGPICDYSEALGQDVWYWYGLSFRHGKSGWVQDGTTYERWLCPVNDPNCDR
jgi:hypothetical protein